MVAVNDPGRDYNSEPQNGAPQGDVPSTNRMKRSRLRRIGSFFWSFLVLVFFVFMSFQIGGLARYAYIVTTPTPPIAKPSEGIVVLTGGENRIRSAMKLLADGKGDRLLITGVNPSLSDETVRAISGVDDRLFECCVEIDRSARNTIGNALATQKWISGTGARSLIVVTGAFHMPRAIRELSHAIKGVELIAYAVNVPQSKKWWRDHSRLRDMLREYAKLVVITARDRLNEIAGQPWPTDPIRSELAQTHSRN